MKNNYLTLFLFLISLGLFAQTSNVTIYAKNGERFLVMLNGLKENEAPQSNVQINGIQPNRYAMKVIFEDQSIPSLEKTIYVEPNAAYTYEIKLKEETGLGKGLKKAGNVIAKDLSKEFNNDTISQEPKSGYVIRVVSVLDLASSQPPPPSNNYNQTPTQISTSENATGTNSETTENVNMNVGVNMGGVGISTNVNVTANTTYTETNSGNETIQENSPQPSAGDCEYTMSSTDYNSATQSISSKSFEDSKMQIAKQITKSNCLTAMQVKGIMDLFTYEESKLDFAKFAYDYTFDKGNYFKVNDSFTYSSSIDDLDAYLSGR